MWKVLIYSTTPVFAIAIQKFKETNSKTCSGQVEIEIDSQIRTNDSNHIDIENEENSFKNNRRIFKSHDI